MMQTSFKVKIIAPALAVLATLSIALIFHLSVKFSAYSDNRLDEKITSNINSLKRFLDESKANSRAAAVSMASNSNAIKAIRDRNRSEILEIFTPTCSLYRINYYIVTDDKGKVLARTHEPDKFDDFIFDQQNIGDALEGRVSTYLEEGTFVKVSARTGAPVYDAYGKLIGVISAGIRFDTDEEVDNLKELFKAEITIFFENTRVATTIFQGGHRIVDTTLDAKIAKIVIENKQEYYGNTDIFGNKYKTFYMPLLNSQDEVFAVFFLGTPLGTLKAESNTLIRNGIIIGIIGLIISSTLLFVVISSISAPVVKLSKNMNIIADGILNINVVEDRGDEVGHLSRAIQKVVNTINKLIVNINTMISEQEKGNTDYRIDTTEFHGDYKKLADNILELAGFGMLDQLTGIPNRRSFDNRLDLEWHRAGRDRVAISLLLLDIDKFKNYNDTFGHQQGDVALQTLANLLARSIKRNIDFAARWGGEEFVVLLPGTDGYGALRVAEQIRSEIENAVIPCADTKAKKNDCQHWRQLTNSRKRQHD